MRHYLSRYVLRIGATIVLLAWVFTKIDFSKIFSVLTTVSILPLLISGALILLAVWLNSVKWHLLLDNYPISVLFETNLIAQFFAVVLPGQVFGDVSKVVVLKKGKGETLKVSLSVLLDKITGLIGLFVVGIVGAEFSANMFLFNLDKAVEYLCLLLILTFLLLFISQVHEIASRSLVWLHGHVVKNDKVFNLGKGLLESLKEYSKQRPVLLLSVALGVLYQFIGVIINFYLAQSIGIYLPIWDWCVITTVMSVMLLLPLSVMGLGVREATIVGLLGYLGVAVEKALVLSLSLFFLQLVLAVIGGILYFNKFGGLHLKRLMSWNQS